MKMFLMFLLLLLLFYSCNNNSYEKELYNKKLKELNQKIAKNKIKFDKIKESWSVAKILVAKTNIKAGSKLTSDMLTEGSLPVKYIRDGMLKPNNMGFIIGQPVITDIQAYDPIFDYDIEPENINLFKISDITPKHLRSVSVKISNSDNSIRPTDIIDVIWVFKHPETHKLTSKILLQNVIVVATGEYNSENIKTLSKNKKIHYDTLNLLLSPQEAQVLNLAKKAGTVSFLLRNSNDYQEIKNTDINLDNLIKNDNLINKLRKHRIEIAKPKVIIP